MRKLKLFFACLLMAVLSIGQVWAADVSVSFDSWTTSISTYSAAEWTDNGCTFTYANNNNKGWAYVRCGGKGTTASSTIKYNTKVGVPVESVVLNTPNKIGNGSSSSITITGVEVAAYSDAAFTTLVSSKNLGTLSYTSSNCPTSFTITPTTAWAKDLYYKITISWTATGSKNCGLNVSGITFNEYEEIPSPSVSVSPDSWDFGTVHASAEASKVFSVSGSNLTAGDLTLTVPEGFSVSPSSIAVNGTLDATNVTVSKNTSDEDDYAGNLEITGGGLASAKTVALTMTVDADPAPTGTFALFSGDLVEGEYVICSGTNAMKNVTTSSPRIDVATVTVSENKIQDPDESLVWKIEALTGDDAGKWTIYNKAVSKYAAFTSTNGRGTLIDNVTDYAKWTTESDYEFVNIGNSGKYLRYNPTYGFASYSTSTGAKLTLYKKEVAGQPATPEFSVAGGNYESAQSVEISCATVGAKIYYTLDGSKPTSTSAEYSTAIPVSATTTIKAVAIKDEIESTVATATYTIVVWQTVDEIWSSITSEGPNNAHVWGYVSQANVGGYNNNYYISVDGSLTANQLEIYKGDNAGNTVAVGDKVHVNGDLTIFNSIKEFKQNTGVIVHYAAKGDLQSVAVSETPTKTEYAAGEDFDPAGLKVYGTYANGFEVEITEGITWGNDLSEGKVTEGTTVHVTATVSGITSLAHDVEVTVAAKTLLSIAVDVDSYTIYTGEVLPQPNVTATYSEGDPENVNALAVYDSENVFNTATIDDPDPQTITVSYTFGGETKTTTYTVSVQDYENANDAPYSVTEALHIITAAIGNVESAREIVVAGTVSAEKVSNYKNRYKISDGANELLVYNGKGFNDEAFTDANYPKVGDVMIVKGKVINYSNNTPEFVSAKSYPLSQVRPATIAIEDVASFEVGTADLAVTDLTVTTPSDGDITFVSGDDAVATIEANAIHAVAPGTVTITANLAATENDDALNYAAASTTFSVTVVAPATKYAITFDGNGATGGSAPTAIEDKAEGDNVTLPANTYTYTGHNFTGWKVYDENEDEVTVTAGAFEMPASPVTIKAQWEEISSWAYVYTSNVTVGTDVVKFSAETEAPAYDAKKTGTGSVWGSTTVTVPVSTSKLHFHAVCYGADAYAVTLNVKKGESVLGTFNINKDAGAKGNSPFILENTPYEQYYFVELSGITEPTVITFEADDEATENGKRFIIFGVNQEGGVLPVLDHIEITGAMTNTTGWKTGDNIVPQGLTVNAYYTLNDVIQDALTEDVTSSVTWSHDALVEDQTAVTLTATYEGKTDTKDVTIDAVETGDPTITTDVNSRSWTVDKDADIPAAKTFAVTLKNITSATITKGGDDPDAFSVTPATLTASGNITVSVVSTETVGTYTATITIKDDASETSKVVNVNLTVNAPEAPETATSKTEWVVATNADLVDGAEVLIVGVNSTTSKVYAAGEQGSNNRAAVEASVDGEGVLTPGANTMSFTLVAQEGSTFALRTSNGKYLYAASSSKNYLRSQATVDDNAKWTLTATSAEANGTNTNETLRFNTANTLFSCYADDSKETAIAFYVPKPAPTPSYGNYPRTVTAGNYGTICLPKAGVISGAKLYEIAYTDGSLIYCDEILSGEMAAGVPYIFYATSDQLNVAYSNNNDPVAATNVNGLYGFYDLENMATDEAAQKNLTQNEGNYILYQNAYWLVSGRAAFIYNFRAYIKLDEISTTAPDPTPGQAPRRRVAMTVNGEQTATGIGELNAAEAPVKMIIDGQLFIIRGEKVYNANGQLVK